MLVVFVFPEETTCQVKFRLPNWSEAPLPVTFPGEPSGAKR